MRMPVIFVGHGSPMLALEDNQLTKNFKAIGDKVIKDFGKPKAILAISAHWFTRGNFIQSASIPKQIYDMYGFPKELYELKYHVKGYKDLTSSVQKILDKDVEINDEWGIDHGTWSVLIHMFPNADIPVVQLSVNDIDKIEATYEIGKKISKLRDEGYLIVCSGNIVHNLMRVEWDNPFGTKMADEFDEFIKKNVLERKDEEILNYNKNKNAQYSVPTMDHFLPFIYALGASVGEIPLIFNNVRNLGSMSMTSYLFGDDNKDIYI